MPAQFSGPLFALGAFALFATHDVIVKLLGGSYTPFQIIFFSTLLSFPLTVMLLLRDETRDNLRPVHPWWTALRTFCAVIATICAFYAFAVLPLAQTYAILFAMPLLITVLAIPILGESVGWRRAVAVAVGLGGVLIVLQPGSTALQLGHFAAMAAAVFSATASVIVRKIGRDERPLVLLLFPMLANFLLMAVLMPADYVPLPLRDLGQIALISLLGLSGGLLLIGAYRRAEAARVAPMQYSQLIWATAYGYFFFNETPGLSTLLGSLIIVGSGLYILFRESSGGRSQSRPVLETRSRGFGSSFRISPFLKSGDEAP